VVSAALELCGITAIAHERAGALSTRQRRLVELARCLAGSFSVVRAAYLGEADTERGPEGGGTAAVPVADS
jgi:ABC-type lipopolysaccharide export system ATPase subunit